MPFDLVLTTPGGVRLEAEAEFLLVPGREGDLGVLPGHSPLLSPLRIGQVIVNTGGKTARFAVSGGFIEIHPDTVLLLAETAEAAEDIDLDRARGARDRARERLDEPVHDTDVARAEAALARALNRLHVAEEA